MKINPTRLISTLAVILAPVGTAWVVIASAIEKPAWPMHWLVALAVGVSIEINGYSTTDLLLTLLRYNDTKKRKSDPSAPTGLAWTLLAIYFASVVTLTILVEVLPTLKQWRAVVFPVMSIAAFFVPVLRSKHERMLREIEEKEAKERKKRQEQKAGKEAKVPAKPKRKVASKSNDWRNLPEEDRQLIKDMSTAEIVAAYAVKDRTARNWVTNARNGNGKAGV